MQLIFQENIFIKNHICKMKKVLICAAWMALMFTSCSKDIDFSAQSTNEQTKHAESVFGVQFASNHTWSSTTTGDVVIKANSSVKKVQVLVITQGVREDGDTYTVMSVLNETELNGKTQVTLRYDAPSNNIGLYVAFISDDNYAVRKIEGNTVSLETAAQNIARRGPLEDGLVLPTGEYKLTAAIPSYANERGWVPGELLYEMSEESYQQMKMTPVAYDKQTLEDLQKLVISYFPQKGDNLKFVKESEFYNEKSYPISTGYEPIIVSPFYKQDGSDGKKGSDWGCEVYNSDLYYYYFKEEELGSDPVEYIKSLPKYKAIPFNQYYTNKHEDDILEKRYSYALIYWGDGIPTIGETVGTFNFPKGYKIGFMVRSKTDYQENGKGGKNGEFYLDGRLNDHINTYGMLVNSKINNGEPRGAWLVIDNHLVMCFETGADKDYNEILMEVEGGVEGIISFPEPDGNVFTYCFEDTENGDYDMNDVVIKATRKNNTTVEYSIIACGARDELYVKNINSGRIMDDAEIHSLFGLTNQFINTEKNATKLQPITVMKTVQSTFSMADPNTQPYIFNKTKNLERHTSKEGEDPHGIMIPNDFQYPLEKVCVKDAYLEFNSWGQNPVLSTNWYTTPSALRIH